MNAWPVLPVVLPLLGAAFLAAVARWCPPRISFWVSLSIALAVAAVGAYLIKLSAVAPIIYWMGGWQPRGPVALGISFLVEPLGAGLACIAALLTAASLIFASEYFDTVHSHFHILMLVFLAAMEGFSLTADLFNLFVFFELMSAAAFPLCGYKDEDPGPVQGALNFAVTNTVGAFLVLIGIALLYGRTGALNMGQIAWALHGQRDGLVLVAFVCIICGFFVKAAVVPFHFWLDDAHAVAPTPVCVLFSGVMVELGLWGVIKVFWYVFAPSFLPIASSLRLLLFSAGALTAVLGAILCWSQRHIKRLLAFSTISHMGVMVMGFGLLNLTALTGSALYCLSHAFIKGSLFLAAGILLHRYSTIDEFDLHGRGRQHPGLAVLFVVGATGLCGISPWGTFLGDSMIKEVAQSLGYSWIYVVDALASGLTAAALFRMTGRIFAGWGPAHSGAPADRKIEESRETRPAQDKTPAVMWGSSAALAVMGFAVGLWPGLEKHLIRWAERFPYAAAIAPSLPASVSPIHPAEYGRAIGVYLGALVLAWITLRFPQGLRRPAHARVLHALEVPLTGLRRLHNGIVGDYVTWLTLGVTIYGVCVIFANR